MERFFFLIFGVDIFGGVSRLQEKRLLVPHPRSFGYIWDGYRDGQVLERGMCNFPLCREKRYRERQESVTIRVML